MRHLSLDHKVNAVRDPLSHLSRELPLPDGVLCPNLEWLDWMHPPPFFHIFLSPNLKRVSLSSQVVSRQPPPAAEIISRLPSSLEHLSLASLPYEDGESLKDAISSLVLRCGPSLRSFGCDPPLSEAAFLHLMQLPNLHSWVAFHEPPRTFSLPTFPSLEALHLGRAALPWLHLLATCGQENHRLTPASAVMNTHITESLKVLSCPENTRVDPTLLSSILSFRNLVSINVTNCPGENCLFDLTDDDVKNFAATLPSLVNLRLGEACNSGGCRTTVSSLLSISTHCLELISLEIHFDTYCIIEDMERLLDEGSGRGKPRCKLQRLSVGCSSLRVPEFTIEFLATGFADIFPYLEGFTGFHRGEAWGRVEAKLRNR